MRFQPNLGKPFSRDLMIGFEVLCIQRAAKFAKAAGCTPDCHFILCCVDAVLSMWSSPKALKVILGLVWSPLLGVFKFLEGSASHGVLRGKHGTHTSSLKWGGRLGFSYSRRATELHSEEVYSQPGAPPSVAASAGPRAGIAAMGRRIWQSFTPRKSGKLLEEEGVGTRPGEATKPMAAAMEMPHRILVISAKWRYLVQLERIHLYFKFSHTYLEVSSC